MKSSTLTAFLLYIFNECRNYNLLLPSFRSEASIGAYFLGNITQLSGQFALTFYMNFWKFINVSLITETLIAYTSLNDRRTNIYC